RDRDAVFHRLRHPAACAGLGAHDIRAVLVPGWRHVVADVVSGAGHRQPGRGREPGRRRLEPGAGAVKMQGEAGIPFRNPSPGHGSMKDDQLVPALAIANLRLAYRVRGVDREAIRGVTLTIGRGESYGLVGESGCGKSTVAYAAMRYLPRNGRITAGSGVLDSHDLLRMGEEELRGLRATKVSMVYQNPGTALNPTIRIGDQVAESFIAAGAARSEAKARALDILTRVQISDPARVMARYPHQLSGGMQQRAVIGMALASNPTLLILDEPTTGLDATVEAEVLSLIRDLRASFGTTVLFISHNLGVIARMCDRVGVLYAGRMVEEGPAWELLTNPRHPYTVGLL